MAIEFRCECGATHAAQASQAGEKFTCPQCGREMTVPADSRGADDLVAQMRAARQEGAGPLPSAAARLRQPKRRPMTRPERAATHLGMKKVLWLPAMAVGLVCLLAGLAGLGMGIYKLATGSRLTVREGKWGPIFIDDRGDERELVFGEDGRAWLVEKDAERIEWKDGRPYPKVGAFDLKAIPADSDPNAKRFAQDIREGEKRGSGNLVLGLVLLVLGPVLMGLGRWMHRDVRLVAEKAAEAAAGQAGAEGSD